MSRFNPGQHEEEGVARRFQPLAAAILGDEARCNCPAPVPHSSDGMCSECGGWIPQKNQGDSMSTALTAPIDVTPLQERLEQDRQTFDALAKELREIPLNLVKANDIGLHFSEFATKADRAAKARKAKVIEEFRPTRTRLVEALKEVDALVARINASPDEIIELARPINTTYMLAVRQQADERQREQERLQREQADREKQAELDRLRQQAAAETDAAEKARIEHEAQAVKEAPPVPVAVPTAAVSRPKPSGLSGTLVYLRRIKDATRFLEFLMTLPTSVEHPADKRNIAILRAAGIELTISFAKLRSSREAIPGVELSQTVDTRNMSKG